jgi:hypothetical protein
MRTLYIEGVENHDGPESCVGVCEGVGEALAGVHAGRAIEPRNVSFSLGCRRNVPLRKATSLAALSRAAGGPCAVEEPEHVWSLHVREPGGPVSARLVDHRVGRSGKAEVVRLR